MKNQLMNIKFTFFIALLISGKYLLSQALPADTLWTKVLGGSKNECDGTAMLGNFGMNSAYTAVDTKGNIYLATSSASNDGFVGGNAGQEDIWIVKLSSDGDTLWTRRFGGSSNERAYRIRTVKSGGVVVVGSTLSTDGSFADARGGYDGFILRIAENGQLIYKKCIGGKDIDHLYDIVENQSGNFVACGESTSSDGDLVGVGSGLAWVIFIDGATGNPLLSKTFTGPDHSSSDFLENLTLIQRLSDGSGYIAAGFTTPDFNDLNKDNIWVLKFNSSGDALWLKKYGTPERPDYPSALLNAGGGGFYISGTTGGTGGDNTAGFYGGPTDGWLIRCDASGNIVWNKNYGGSDWDVFYDAVVQPSGNLLISGFTRSTNNDLTATTPAGLADYWLLQVSETGVVKDMRRIGGSKSDMGIGLACDTLQNRVILVGRSESNDGYVQRNLGGKDLWMVSFGEKAINNTESINHSPRFRLFPNPTSTNISVKTDADCHSLIIRDLSGRELLRELNPQKFQGQYTIDLSSLNPGMYLLHASSNEEFVYPIIKSN